MTPPDDDLFGDEYDFDPDDASGAGDGSPADDDWGGVDEGFAEAAAIWEDDAGDTPILGDAEAEDLAGDAALLGEEPFDERLLPLQAYEAVIAGDLARLREFLAGLSESGRSVVAWGVVSMLDTTDQFDALVEAGLFSDSPSSYGAAMTSLGEAGSRAVFDAARERSPIEPWEYDAGGLSALSEAANSGRTDLVAHILSGASVDPEEDAVDEAIDVACSRGYRDIVELLLPHADLDAEDRAEYLEELADAEREFAHMARPATTPADFRLVCAVDAGDASRVAAALTDGADPDAPTVRGGYPLHRVSEAREGGRLAVALRLIEAGADVNRKSEESIPVLHNAVYEADEELVRALVERGADVNAVDDAGDTALGEAIDHGLPGVVRILVEHGATDDEGRSLEELIAEAEENEDDEDDENLFGMLGEMMEGLDPSNPQAMIQQMQGRIQEMVGNLLGGMQDGLSQMFGPPRELTLRAIERGEAESAVGEEFDFFEEEETAFLAEGFRFVSFYQAQEAPITIEAYVNESERMLAVTCYHAAAPDPWSDVAALFAGDAGRTHSSNPITDDDDHPDRPVIRHEGATAEDLVALMRSDLPNLPERLPIDGSVEGFKKLFEEAYKQDIEWRWREGGSLQSHFGDDGEDDFDEDDFDDEDF